MTCWFDSFSSITFTASSVATLGCASAAGDGSVLAELLTVGVVAAMTDFFEESAESTSSLESAILSGTCSIAVAVGILSPSGVVVLEMVVVFEDLSSSLRPTTGDGIPGVASLSTVVSVASLVSLTVVLLPVRMLGCSHASGLLTFGSPIAGFAINMASSGHIRNRLLRSSITCILRLFNLSLCRFLRKVRRDEADEGSPLASARCRP
uniref:Secreted protein n=1 Tax=Anopheles darlingi TaxID=43151 RepID=A0A2M4CZX1_ANODA